MIKTVFYWLLALFILSFLVYWVWSGGIGRVSDSFHLIKYPFSATPERGASINASANDYPRLPWQSSVETFPAAYLQGNPENSTAQKQYTELEGQYEQLNRETNRAKVFGDPSPMKGQVRITEAYGVSENSPAKEYVVLTANTYNTAPVELKGWSLQSAYTGMRAHIPLSASSFTMGILNDQENVLLYPGASAIVNSGGSPVGTSFRENMCSGYLGQFQNYYPPLSNSCPSAYDALAFTPENLKVYGETCFDFLQTIPTCTAPLRNVPASVNPNCRAFAANVFSYNGCVANNRFRPTFNSNSWRLYLGANVELWRNTHDIIRLLDDSGRTVDVVTY